MNIYELVLILNPSLSDDEQKKIVTKVEKQIGDLKGKVSSKEEWGKKKLAYEIKKFSEGFYFLIKVEMEPGVAEKVQNSIKMEEKIIRFLLIKVS